MDKVLLVWGHRLDIGDGVNVRTCYGFLVLSVEQANIHSSDPRSVKRARVGLSSFVSVNKVRMHVYIMFSIRKRNAF